MTLSDLPPELFEQVLLFLDPTDVSAVSRTCHTFHQHINDPDNQLLWRELYLAQPFDDLRRCVTPQGRSLSNNIDWMKELRRVIRARTVVTNEIYRSAEETVAVFKTLLGMAANVVPLPSYNSDELSLNHAWLYSLLRGSSFLNPENPVLPTSEEERQLRAQLRTLYGLTAKDHEFRTLVDSRALVYAMRNYRETNQWGPFKKDGSGEVDWVHLKAIHHVMSMHIVLLAPSLGSQTLIPLSLPFCQPCLPPELDLDTMQDWAGIEGFWRCSFCFCTQAYNDLDRSDTEPLSTAFFEDPDFGEVFTGINMQCRVVSCEHDPDHPTRPIIHFEAGTERQSVIKGWVKLTHQGVIRWHFQSGQGDQFIWNSEGIQVGSVRSAYGVLGSWSTTLHEQGDPVGPFVMWKMAQAAGDIQLDTQPQ
ncbi:hypothetical protein EIP86_002529 [Pleurotus ostreatoroseus]|nr:hypothetical protein EIP86_002529 [Pleurotus ostreatoroseus]